MLKSMPPKMAVRLKRFQEKMKNKQPKQYRLQARRKSDEREKQKEAIKAYEKVLRDMESYAKAKEKSGLSDQA